MARKRAGRPRTPSGTPPVSNPQTGARTDGGASQPVRVPTGGPYGSRKELTEQQQSAPMAVAPPSATAAPSPRQQGGVGNAQAGVPMFGPTERPNEDPTTGLADPSSNPIAANPQLALRVIYGKFPHPAIARLIDWSTTSREGTQSALRS